MYLPGVSGNSAMHTGLNSHEGPSVSPNQGRTDVAAELGPRAAALLEILTHKRSQTHNCVGRLRSLNRMIAAITGIRIQSIRD